MKLSYAYTRDDGQEYILNWWSTDEYSHLFSVIQKYSGMDPNWYTRTPEYELIKAIYGTGVNFDNPGWYWAITKQNLIDIDREYNNLLQNNLNNNEFNDNNCRKSDNIKIDNDSGYSTDDTTDNKYSRFYNWQNQYNNIEIREHTKINLQQKKNEMLQRQKINQRLQNEMRENMSKYVGNGLKKFEHNISNVLQKYDNLYSKDNRNSVVYYNINPNRNRYNNNLRSNIYTNISNHNNIKWRDCDLNNILANSNNKKQIKQSSNYSYNKIDLNNNKNEKFNPNCIWDYEYQDLLQAIREYDNINPNTIEDYAKKQFAQVLKAEGVNSKHWGWWYDIDITKFKKIKAAYDNMKKGYDELHNKKDNNNKEEKKIYANREAHGFYNGNQIIDYYNLDHRISKRYLDHAISRVNAEEYIMNSKNINGIYNRI